MYDWLINYIPEPINKTMSGGKGRIMSLFKTNIIKSYSKPKRVENVYKNQGNQKCKINLKIK